MKEENMKNLIENLGDCFYKEKFKQNPLLVKALCNLKSKKDDFLKFFEFKRSAFFAIALSLSEMKELKYHTIANGIIEGTFEHFVRTYIERTEGSPCSGDKTSFIVRKVIKSLVEDEDLSLYDTYEGCDNISKDKWNEQAYWSPKTLKSTKDIKALYKKWYYLK